MKANVKRPARFSFKTITEKKAKHLTLIFVAVLFLVIVVLALFPLLDREEERYEVTTYAMGSYVQQTVYGENREDAAVKAADAVEALEQKISWRVANSDIQKLNNNAGKDWVTLSDETLNVLTQAQSVSEKSGGAFDVTIAPISRLWDFDDELNEVPDSDLITSGTLSFFFDFLFEGLFIRGDRLTAFPLEQLFLLKVKKYEAYVRLVG